MKSSVSPSCLWDWQAAEHCESNAASHDVSRFMWDCLNQDDDDLLGLLGNQTPLRDCRGFFDIDGREFLVLTTISCYSSEMFA
jgi:hypothetical protein